MKNIILVLIICSLFITSHTIEAATDMYLHTFSYHEDRASNYNENNYGIGVRHNSGDNYFLTAGGYRNSKRKNSLYGGIGWESKGDFVYGVSGGLISGYSDKIYLFIFPFFRYKGFSLVVIPTPEKIVHLTIDILEF